MDKKLKRKYGINIAIAVLSAGIIILSSFLFSDFYESFELKTVDLRFRLRGPIPQRKDIVFIEMDEQAIQDLGRWPWPRDIFADIVEALKSLRAKVILFDITFAEPSQLFIDREKLKEGIQLEENKKILDDFINETAELFSQGKLDADSAKESLGQIRAGLDTWKEGIKQTLNAAVRDNDALFSQSIKDAGNVYLGFKAEVIYTPQDINRNSAYPQLKNGLREWAKNAPQGTFEKLPSALKTNPFFSPKEINHLLLRAKIYNLLQKQPELGLSATALSLGEENLARVRPEYNDLKNEIYKEKIAALLKEEPQVSFKELAWKTGIIEPANIQILKKQYEHYILQEAFAKKAGVLEDTQRFFSAINISPPILPLTESMHQSGFLNAIPDTDGVLRNVPLFIRYKDKVYPHITVWLLADLLETTPQKLLESIPLDKNGSLYINWAGKWAESFRHLSASDIYRLKFLEQNLEYNRNEDKQRLQETQAKLQKEIKDSICLIGLTAPGTHDYNPIPLQPDYPMLGTHANILNTILQGKFLQQTDSWVKLAGVIFLSLLIGLGITSLAPIHSLIFALCAAIVYCLTSILLFNYRGLLIDIMMPLGTIFLSYVGINSYNFATEEKEKRWIRKAFSHYVSKNVMEEILKDPAKLKLGGQRKELTVLFSDIRSFTNYSEKRRPEEVVAILNEYLDEMTKIIFKNNGTLDKYVGDEIMAIFGAPSPIEETDHAQRAVRTALEMMEKLKQLQNKWLAEGKEPFDIGIGINTGPMLIGNMGSTERMDYTVIGDAVNLGARVEALTREYNNHIIITEFTYHYVKDMVEVKKLDEVKVKGKEKPVLIYEVIRLKT